MRRIALVMTAVAATLALPGAALAGPQSFQRWAVGWNALTTRDNARVVKHCQTLYGSSDLKFGMCYVEAGRANLRAERVLWEQQMARVVRGQPAPCRKAISTYMSAARLKQRASLVYLDSHRRTSLSRIASDITGEPYAALKKLNDDARERAVAICG